MDAREYYEITKTIKNITENQILLDKDFEEEAMYTRNVFSSDKCFLSHCKLPPNDIKNICYIDGYYIATTSCNGFCSEMEIPGCTKHKAYIYKTDTKDSAYFCGQMEYCQFSLEPFLHSFNIIKAGLCTIKATTKLNCISFEHAVNMIMYISQVVCSYVINHENSEYILDCREPVSLIYKCDVYGDKENRLMLYQTLLKSIWENYDYNYNYPDVHSSIWMCPIGILNYVDSIDKDQEKGIQENTAFLKELGATDFVKVDKYPYPYAVYNQKYREYPDKYKNNESVFKSDIEKMNLTLGMHHDMVREVEKKDHENREKYFKEHQEEFFII